MSLNELLLAVNTCLKIGDVPDKVKERLIKINHHSDNLVNLINDLLDMSLPSIENMSMKINLGMFNETFDEYLKETLLLQELPLGIKTM